MSKKTTKCSLLYKSYCGDTGWYQRKTAKARMLKQKKNATSCSHYSPQLPPTHTSAKTTTTCIISGALPVTFCLCTQSNQLVDTHVRNNCNILTLRLNGFL